MKDGAGKSQEAFEKATIALAAKRASAMPL